MIPVFVFEEHNEAFFIWHYSVHKQIIPDRDNTLLHVDHHADFQTSWWNRSIKDLDTKDLSDLYRFTYQELDIADFIVPAIYQGLFKKFYWLKSEQSALSAEPYELCIFPADDGGQRYLKHKIFKPGTFFGYKAVPGERIAYGQKLTVFDRFKENQSVVLDIDLDYFSCNHEGYTYRGRLEITEDQYQSFIRDRYHCLRLLSGSNVTAQVDNGKYYIVFNEHPDRNDLSNAMKVSELEIVNRIERFIAFLQDKKVNVQMICLCRSRISGFTPEEQWQFIEAKLLEELGKVFELQIFPLDEILAEQGLNHLTLQ